MNGPEKSDKPVVPMRPANAGETGSFWDLFERVQRAKGRGLAKENEDQADNAVDLVFRVEGGIPKSCGR